MRNLQVLFLFEHKDFQICISIPLKKPISTSINKPPISRTCAEHVLLFSELHDVKTEGSTSCKELLGKQCPLVYYRKK